MRVAVSEQTLSAPFTSDTTLLVAAKVGLRYELLPAVDPDTSGFETQGDALGGLDVFAPDAGTETALVSLARAMTSSLSDQGWVGTMGPA